MKRIISLLLFAVMLVLALASCGGKGGDDTTTVKPADTTTAKPADTTTVPVTTTTDKWESVGAEVQALAEDQRTLKFELSNYSSAELASKCDEYMAGPDELTAETSTIQRMVYQRNETAKEALGLTITYEYVSLAWGQAATPISTKILANDASAADLFCNMVFDISNATLTGIFRDVLSMEDGYFDFTTNGWFYEYMEGMSFTGDRMYLLGSDYFLDMLRALVVLPLNVTVMDANAGKLSSVILGTDGVLAAGATLSDKFFEYVADGNWTYDAMIALCEAIFVDDGATAGADDLTDMLGFATSSTSGMCPSAFIYTTNTVCVETGKDADGKTVLTYPIANDALNALFLKVRALMEANGTWAESTKANDDIAKTQTQFAADKLLFGSCGMLGSLELDVYQNMTSVFSALPMPKLATTDDYNTMIHNIGNAGAININSTKYVAVSAFLQYCAENSADIRTEYMEIVMKYKVVEHNDGTDEMLNIIYNGIKESRQKAIDDAVCKYGDCNSDRWHSLLMAGKYLTNTASLGDKYDAARSKKQAYLDEIVDIWYNLPTTARPSEPSEPPAAQ